MQSRINRTNPWLFFSLTFAWTWAFWGFLLISGLEGDTPLGGSLMLVGVMGPSVMGVYLTRITRNAAERKDFWRRVFSFRQIPLPWLLFVILLPLAAQLFAGVLDALAGGLGIEISDKAREIRINPLALLPSLLFSTLIPFLEELGRSGYVLDRLHERFQPLISASILGIFWSVWHLPLFFISGTYQAELGIGTFEFWLFLVGIVPLAFSFTLVFLKTGRSILATIILHSMVNFFGELFTLSEAGEAYFILVWVIAAVAIGVYWLRSKPALDLATTTV